MPMQYALVSSNSVKATIGCVLAWHGTPSPVITALYDALDLMAPSSFCVPMEAPTPVEEKGTTSSTEDVSMWWTTDSGDSLDSVDNMAQADRKVVVRRRASRWAGDKLSKICRRFARSGSCVYGDSCRFSHCTAPPDSEEVSDVVQETNDLSLVSSQSVSNAWSPVGAKRRHAEKDALLELRVLSEMKELTTRAYAAMGIQSWWRGTLSRRSLNTITFPSIPEFPILAVDAVDSDAVARCARRRSASRAAITRM